MIKASNELDAFFVLDNGVLNLKLISDTEGD